MAELKYTTNILLPKKAYKEVSDFLIGLSKRVEFSKGYVFYLDVQSQEAVRISTIRLFRKRKIELSDKVEQGIINYINHLINPKEVGEDNNDR